LREGIVPERRAISVFGGSHPREGSPAYGEAQRLGSLLASEGFTVVSGGYAGVMDAVSRGAFEGGGHTVGVTLAAFDRWSPNPWLCEERRAPDLFTRQEWLICQADGIIVLPGGAGTLAELFVTWNLLQIGAMAPKPVVLVGQAWYKVLDAFTEHLHLRARDLALVRVTETVEEGVRVLLDQLGA
jgi:uncharacterized protein (TIGR00730 family)